MKKILQLKLKILAQLIIRKYKPKVVGITGSVGKTSTKEAIAHILKKKFNVRMTYKNYNNEIGLPLTIIGSKSPGRSVWGWIKVFSKALSLLLFKSDYPDILILEMGVDRPGDMDYLLSIVSVDVGVVTSISQSHLEYFGSVVNIKKEKQHLIEKVSSQGLVVLNYDNNYTREMANVSKAKVITYGLDKKANLKAQDINFNYSQGDYELNGLNFKLNNNGSIVPIYIKYILSDPALYAILAAVSVALYFDINLVEVSQYLIDFHLPPGRMNYIPGIKNTFIIDDTYNASPESTLSALQTLSNIKIDLEASRYAVLGEMLEIGHYTVEGHKLVGRKVAELKIDYLISVGEKARDISRGAIEAGMDKDNIFYFPNSVEAASFIKQRIEAGDLVLVKGSQGVRMEKIVKEIMTEPDKAEKLLVRQGKEWRNK